jgi:nitric oxide reductase NorE protein
VSTQLHADPVVDQFKDPFSRPVGRAAPNALLRRSRSQLPGEVGVWVFIFGDLVVFTVFFVVFLYERGHDHEVFEASRKTLDLRLGAVNTILLLTGSLFVALGVQAARRQSSTLARRMLVLAMLCGTGFVANKALEYGSKIQAGHTPAQNDFYMYFFAFTAIHLVHLLVGLLVLGLMWRIAGKAATSARDIRNLEAGACYWHLVDVLWIVLFGLLYLVRSP